MRGRLRLDGFVFRAAAVLIAAAAVALCARALSHRVPTAAKPSASAKHYSLLIDVNEKRLYLLSDGKLVKKYVCAVGKSDTPSPLGSYRITQKSHWGEGFGGYWLGIDCPWGNYGIHGTRRPATVGAPASHGCFRMYQSDIKELYSLVPSGTPVLITGGAYGPFGNGSRIIVPGMYGLDVQVVQKKLRVEGYFKGDCNGRYDSAGFTEAAHRFQKDHGLPVSDYINQKMLSALGFVMMD